MIQFRAVGAGTVMFLLVFMLPMTLFGVDMSDAQKLMNEGKLKEAIVQMESDLSTNPDDFSLRIHFFQFHANFFFISTKDMFLMCFSISM